MTNRKLYVRFRLASWSMTLDDTELQNFEFHVISHRFWWRQWLLMKVHTIPATEYCIPLKDLSAKYSIDYTDIVVVPLLGSRIRVG